MKDAVCALCGKPVFPSSPYTRHQKYCSDECRNEMRRIKQRDNKKLKRQIAENSTKKKHSLDEDMLEANRQKISYGNLIARRYENGK